MFSRRPVAIWNRPTASGTTGARHSACARPRAPSRCAATCSRTRNSTTTVPSRTAWISPEAGVGETRDEATLVLTRATRPQPSTEGRRSVPARACAASQRKPPPRIAAPERDATRPERPTAPCTSKASSTGRTTRNASTNSGNRSSTTATATAARTTAGSATSSPGEPLAPAVTAATTTRPATRRRARHQRESRGRRRHQRGRGLLGAPVRTGRRGGAHAGDRKQDDPGDRGLCTAASVTGARPRSRPTRPRRGPGDR